MRSERDKTRAFTLIETIAAVVILAIAIPPMLWAVRGAHRDRVNPVLASRARWLAQEKLEDVIADRHSATCGYDYLLGTNYPTEPSITGFPGFSRSVSLNETAADLVSLGTGYMTVTVSVNWMDGNGDSQTLSIATVLTEYSP